MSLFFWFVFDSALVALVTTTLVDLSASMPTVRKVYYEPQKEDKTAWALFFLGAIANVFAIREWIFAIALYPVAMVLVIGLITGLLFLPRKRVFQ
ncbi:MAG: hypothetical protein WCW78_03210 [Candidatus Paceibacterota bacterium]